jgi:hypothetical protein
MLEGSSYTHIMKRGERIEKFKQTYNSWAAAVTWLRRVSDVAMTWQADGIWGCI